jgi:hypothetical protein
MNSLGTNIKTLKRIQADWGGLDKFVTSGDPDWVANEISRYGRPYKLQQLGYALAMEYLRNVGIRAAKPDRHVLRVLGPKRLAYLTQSPSEKAAVQLVAKLAASAGCNATYVDNLLWLFCAQDYGAICGATPRCHVCAFIESCQYPTKGKV